MYGDGPLDGYRVRGRSIADIRGTAEVVRRSLGLAENWVDIEALLESLPNWGITCSVVERGYLPPGVEACFDPDSLTIYFDEGTYRGIRNNHPRARFTAVHELGHCLLAHKKLANRGVGQPMQVFEDSEWQANQFAAEFLMPLSVIKTLRLYSPAQVMNAFGVSFDAASTRLKQLRKRNEL